MLPSDSRAWRYFAFRLKHTHFARDQVLCFERVGNTENEEQKEKRERNDTEKKFYFSLLSRSACNRPFIVARDDKAEQSRDNSEGNNNGRVHTRAGVG